jgi:hypothetical protein
MEPNSALTFGTGLLVAFFVASRQKQRLTKKREQANERKLEQRLAFLLEVLEVMPTYEVVPAT